MKHFKPLCSLLLLACALSATAAEKAEPENGERFLHIYTWADYFDSNVINAFQQKYRCRVSIDSYESNEYMYTALTSNGGNYDIVTPSVSMAAALHHDGLLLKLDHARLPNLNHLDANAPASATDHDMVYSVPYTQTVSGIGYSRKHVARGKLDNLAIFGDPEFARRVSLLNDMRETLGAALIHLGYSANATDAKQIEAAGRLVGEWKKNSDILDLNPAMHSLESGALYAAHAFNGDVAMIIDENPDIDFFIPPSGTTLNSDVFVIAANTPVPDLAYAFINHMLDPEMAKINMENILYYMPNTTALGLLSDTTRKNPAFNISPDVAAKSELIRDLGPETNAIYERVWQSVLGSHAK